MGCCVETGLSMGITAAVALDTDIGISGNGFATSNFATAGLESKFSVIIDAVVLVSMDAVAGLFTTGTLFDAVLGLLRTAVASNGFRVSGVTGASVCVAIGTAAVRFGTGGAAGCGGVTAPG